MNLARVRVRGAVAADRIARAGDLRAQLEAIHGPSAIFDEADWASYIGALGMMRIESTDPRLFDNFELDDAQTERIRGLDYASHLIADSRAHTLIKSRARPDQYFLQTFSFHKLYEVLKTFLMEGKTVVRALLPYSYMPPGSATVRTTPTRAYTSVEDLREHFWSDIRARIRFLVTGHRGDEEQNTRDAPKDINSGVTFLDHPAGIEIHTSDILPRGACNKHETSYPVLKGKFSDYRTVNPASDGNNCGLHCLRLANANLPSVKKMRVQSLIPKGPISAPDMVRIGKMYHMSVQVFTDDSNEEDLWDALNTGSVCLYLSGQHYKLISAKTIWYTCPICKRKLRSKEADALKPHECRLATIVNLTNHPNVKVKRIDAAYDIETRGDLSRLTEYDIAMHESGDPVPDPKDKSSSVYVVPQVPTLLCFAFTDKDGNLERRSFLGLDCIDKFLEELVALHKQYVYLDLYAHNGSRFDALFILNAIKNHPEYSKYTEVDDCVIKGTRILAFSFLNHTFKGTENYLEGSLDKLCTSFNIAAALAKKKTCVIDGHEMTTMELCLMMPRWSPKRFVAFMERPANKEYKDNYVDYCMLDCVSLMEVWRKFKTQMLESVIPTVAFPYLEIVFQKSCTLPGAAMRVFKAVHSKKVVNSQGKAMNVRDYWCPTSKNPAVVKLLTDAKLGGISHVAQPGLHIGRISLVDVKSLYPSRMLQCEYPSGPPMEIMGDKECRDFVHAGYLAVIWCADIKLVTNTIAHYPARTKTGLDWGASYIQACAMTSLDILRILRNGGSMRMEWGIGWTNTSNPFIPVIQRATDIKVYQDELKEQKSPDFNPVLREATKLFGNALFGKMLENSKNHKWEEFDNLWEYSQYDPEGKYDVRFCNGHFYIKVPEDQEIYPPLQFGVFILAHSREMMQRYFDMVGRQNIIASETDSIHCHDQFLLGLKTSNDPLYRIGDKYGQMVVEYPGTIAKAFFLGKKCYAYIEMHDPMKDEKFKKRKCKGISTVCLTDDFYWTLYKNRSASVSNMRVFRRHLFTDVKTGVSIEYLRKTVSAGDKLVYREYNLV